MAVSTSSRPRDRPSRARSAPAESGVGRHLRRGRRFHRGAGALLRRAARGRADRAGLPGYRRRRRAAIVVSHGPLTSRALLVMPPMSTTSLAHRTLTGPSAGPHLLITAGVHGDEFEPMAAVRQLIRTLDPRRLRGRMTLVPVVN